MASDLLDKWQYSMLKRYTLLALALITAMPMQSDDFGSHGLNLARGIAYLSLGSFVTWSSLIAGSLVYASAKNTQYSAIGIPLPFSKLSKAIGVTIAAGGGLSGLALSASGAQRATRATLAMCQALIKN